MYIIFAEEMHVWISTTISEKDPYIVIIQKNISYMTDCLHTRKSTLQIKQDAQIKITKKLAKEVKQLKAIISNFSSEYFQLIFTSKKNKLLSQNFDHTFYRRESLFLLLYI